MKIKTMLLSSSLVLGGLLVGGHTQQAHAATLNNDNNTVTVQKGDTLWSIGQQFGTSVNDLMSLNNLYSNLIIPGQQLKLHGNVTTVKPMAIVPVQKVVATQKVAPVQHPVQHVVTVPSPHKVTTPVQHMTTTPVKHVVAPVQQHVNTPVNNNNNNIDASTAAAMAYIANHESGGNYNARNGQFVGKWQLSASYLHGDYSPANQDRVANQYVHSRYGSWQNAAQHERTYGWY